MKFKIVAEGHEGVFSVEEECIATVEANSPEEALSKCPLLQWNETWDCWLLGVRKVVVKEVGDDEIMPGVQETCV